MYYIYYNYFQEKSLLMNNLGDTVFGMKRLIKRTDKKKKKD